MEKLRKISENYISLIGIAENLQKTELFDLVKKNSAKTNKMEAFFVKESLKYGREKGWSLQHLVREITTEILKSRPPIIEPFLLVKLMWVSGEKTGIFCLKSLERLFWYLLRPTKIDYRTEYIVESLLDIWNADSDELIPIDILETVILKQHLNTYSYGALIKAVSYLEHEKHLVEAVLSKARRTPMYQNDDNYVEWVESAVV